jgi:hypothetical protein
MNKYIKIIVSVIAVIVIILLAKGFTSKKQITTDQSIKIGAVLSLTGPASVDGEAIKQGLEGDREGKRSYLQGYEFSREDSEDDCYSHR